MREVDRIDSEFNGFFSRETEHIKTRTYDIEYPDLRARFFAPASGESNPGATSLTYRQFDKVGRAKIISNNAKDIPRVDVNGKEFTRPVREVAASYGWTIKEIRAAAMANRPLDRLKATAARDATEEELDFIACFGAPEHGIVDGLLNSAAVPLTTLGGGQDWATLAATAAGKAAIVQQVSDAVQRVVAATAGIHKPNTVVIPDAQHALIATTPFGDNSDKTILDFMESNLKMISAVEPWYRMTGAGVGADRMLVYKRADGILEQDIPGEFEQLPAQEQGLEMVVHTMASTSGTSIYRPLALDYTDGI